MRSRIVKAWRFLHGIDTHTFNADVSWARSERWLWIWAWLFVVGLYTGVIDLKGDVAGTLILTFTVGAMLYFTALNRRTLHQQDGLLDAYGKLADDQTHIVARQRDIILAHRLRQDLEEAGYNGSPSMN